MQRGVDVVFISEYIFTGFNHTINGLPRYRFLKEEERGIFNLFIRNVSLEDDAEFQCQVGPAVSPIIHKPLRSAANLTVICKYIETVFVIISTQLNDFTRINLSSDVEASFICD